MARVTSLLCALLASLAAPVEPTPIPSGMDLLYDDHVPLLAHGEPIITLGIVSGEKHVAVRATAPMRIDFYEDRLSKRAEAPMNVWVDVTIHRAKVAVRQHYVDIEGIAAPSPHRVQAALAVWKKRGIMQITPQDEGVVLGMGGRVLDTRSVRLIVPTTSAASALRLAKELSSRFGARAVAKERLAERPWGELKINVGSTSLGLATSYVRFSTQGKGLMQVADVEFAKGYPWHGRADRFYHDDLYAVADPTGQLAVINAAGAETILAGVVPAEIFASAPMEALEAQARSARNISACKTGASPCHGALSPLHRAALSGLRRGRTGRCRRTTEAVRATSGHVLFHDDVLVDAVYSSNCGGHTVDNEAVWGELPNPALRGRPDFEADNPLLRPFVKGITAANVAAFMRMQPPTYCARATQAKPDRLRWQKTLQQAEIQALIRADGSARSASCRPLKNSSVATGAACNASTS